MIALAVVCGQVASGQDRAAISNGLGALARRDVPGARREFARAAADTSNRSLRSAGEQWLGRLSWMIDADSAAASKHLHRALVESPDSSSVLLERARLLRFERRYTEAVRTASTAARFALDDERRGTALRMLIDIAADGAMAAVDAHAPAGDSVERDVVGPAADSLRERVSRFPGRTTDASAYLTGSILTNDDAGIAAGWRSYFLLIDDSTSAQLAGARRMVEQHSFIGGLAASGMYESAALRLAIAGRRPVDSQLPDLAAYARFLRAVRSDVDEVYRRSLIGVGRTGDLQRAVNARTRALWAALQWVGPAPSYFPAAVPAELRRRFGAVMSIETADAAGEATISHVIASFAPDVAGLEAPPHEHQFVLDGVVLNGFDSWLLDGAGGRAGWAVGDSIFQVRPAFTETPFRAWIDLVDPQYIPGALVRAERDSALDVARARLDSAAYLPGVAARMFRDGTTRILDSIARALPAYADQENAFVSTIYRALTRSTIVLHETRHVVDGRAGAHPMIGADAEFRAKIDEVALAPRPRLALTAILHPNIGDRTSHGQANRRVMLGLIRWMRTHSAEIVGLDRSLPILTQLPLLDDAQLRSAFRAMRVAA